MNDDEKKLFFYHPPPPFFSSSPNPQHSRPCTKKKVQKIQLHTSILPNAAFNDWVVGNSKEKFISQQ
jgi:hypothetical protein